MLPSSTVLLTGATAGIGRATAKALAPLCGKIILVSRSEKKLLSLIQELSQETSPDRLDYVVADLSEPTQILTAVNEIKSRYDQIDILINNAGGYFSERRENSVGYEYTFALNHLGYWHLSTQLLDLMTASPRARIINVSSGVYPMGKIHQKDLMLRSDYSGMKAYAQSKLANIFFTRVLARRLEGKGITVNCLHPGTVGTDFMKNIGSWVRPFISFVKLFMLSPEKGAETTIYLATSPEVAEVSGQYFVRKKVVHLKSVAQDDALAEWLWDESERLVAHSVAV